MIFQTDDWSRLLLIFIIQPIIAILFCFLAYKVIKRNRNRGSLTLTAFYLVSASSLVSNTVFVISSVFNELFFIYLFYYMTIYLLLFSPTFIVLFMNVLLKLEETFTNTKYLITLILFALFCVLIFFFPDGFTLSSINNYRPIYSVPFLIFLYIFITVIILLPTGYYSLRFFKSIEAQNLKVKARYLIIGIFELIFTLYGTVLFNTWTNPIFRSIWALLATLLLITSALLIYYGIGQNL
ncbi:MAG: hypothetical protein EU535_06950 [Promethearchaeota archaeon]|nr:MAG: hypothetical protein EU535_06950 [Candidatus Lokiarchaeota archaeon]